MRRLVFLALAALAAMALAACGGGGDDSSSSTTSTTSTTTTSAGGGGGAKSTLKVEADPSGNLAYTQTSLTAKAGSVTIDFNNPSSVPHNVQIQDPSGGAVGGTDTVTGSSTSTTVDLKPGTYAFFCSVDGHEAAGMKGTLTVK